MADTTTTTTQAQTATTTTTKAPTTTTTTTKAADSASPAKKATGTDNSVPSREESLKVAGQASPHAKNIGIKDGTKVLGTEGQTTEDRMDDARREALANAKDETKLRA